MSSVNRFKFSEPSQSNPFLYKDTSHGSHSSNYKYKDDDFPDLTVDTNKIENETQVNEKKYLSAAAVVADVKTVENKVSPGCIKYEKYKGDSVLHVTYGDKINNNSKILIGKSKYMDLSPLVDNWNRYKLKYDEIHGEGAYVEAYYMDSVYGLYEEFSDTESDYDPDVYDNYEEYETY